MALPKHKWLKFRVTEEEYKAARNAFTESGERWFWRWCQKTFVRSVKNVPQSTK